MSDFYLNARPQEWGVPVADAHLLVPGSSTVIEEPEPEVEKPVTPKAVKAVRPNLTKRAL